MPDIQNTDAFIDHQIHNLKNLPHQQDKGQDEEDNDKRDGNFPKYVTVNDFIHVFIVLFLKVSCIGYFSQAKHDEFMKQ